MKFKRVAQVAVAAFLAASGAQAQTISLGTNPQGSLAYATGSALSSVAIDKADLRMRVVPQGGPNVVVPIVNAGEMEFSIASGTVLTNAFTGTGEFSQPNENIRVAAVLFNLNGGFMVRADSDIETLEDLEGKRVASGFIKQKAVQLQAEAVLGTVGLSYDHVEAVPVPNGVRGVEDFEAGRVDATYFAISSGRTMQADATVDGIRILPIAETDEADESVKSATPGAYVDVMQPGPNRPGVTEPIGVYATPLVVLANADVDEQVVYDFVKAIHDNKEALAAAAGAFNAFDPAGMSRDLGIPMHPGAERFYSENGM